MAAELRGVVILAVACACGRTPIAVADLDDDDPSDTSTTEVGDAPPDCDLDDHVGDCDGDGIPDADDPFPEDRDRPGRARPDLIYLQSSTTLSTLDMAAGVVVTPIADFTFPDDNYGQVTDIAIDRFGVLYAISSALLHACHPTTAECWALGELPTNSLGFVPIGILDDDDDMLVTLLGSTWMHVGLRGPEVAPKVIGEVESPYSSSGDIATTAAGLTVFTSNWATGGDVVVAIDPATGGVISLLGSPPTIMQVWGVVAYEDALVVCDQLGMIMSFDPSTGAGATIGGAPHECWGAAGHPDLR